MKMTDNVIIEEYQKVSERCKARFSELEMAFDSFESVVRSVGSKDQVLGNLESWKAIAEERFDQLLMSVEEQAKLASGFSAITPFDEDDALEMLEDKNFSKDEERELLKDKIRANNKLIEEKLENMYRLKGQVFACLDNVK